MPFAYYQRLSPRKRAIYRKSAALRRIDLPCPGDLRPLVEVLEQALETGERRLISRRARSLLAALADQLEVPRIHSLRVLAVRPSDAEGELHGLYERELDSGRTRISVWMRTAARARVVAFRTFLRTLVHELCHHLDYERYRLGDSYHTEGFFARESALMKQLVPARVEPPITTLPSPQLELPW